MPLSNKYHRQLRKTVLWTVPLLALYMATPIILFIQTRPADERALLDPSFGRITFFLGSIMTGMFLAWKLNLWLLHRFISGQGLWGFRREAQRYGISFLLLFLFAVPVSLAVEYLRPIDIGVFRYYPLVGLVAVNFFILLLINLVVKQNEAAELKLEKAELEILQLTTQQEQLKQQIHPHFLFNALSTLRILIDSGSDRAATYTATLAKFLRTSLSVAQNDLESVTAALDFLQQYFDLQRMRFGEGIRLSIDVPEEVRKTGQLPVFALQILAENAIKHNAFSVASPLRVSISWLPAGYLRVTNNAAPKFQPEPSTGIGLRNLTLRFQHFTTEAPTVTRTEEEFTVLLRVLHAA